MKKYLSICLIILMSICLLTGCGGSAKSSDAYNGLAVETTAAAAYAPGAGAPVEMAEMEYYAEASTTDTGALRTEMGKSESSGTGDAINKQNAAGRKLIRTVNLSVETDDFEALLTALQEKVAALEGYIEQSDISGKSIQYENSRRRGHMTVRIPSTKLDQFVVSVEESGNVVNKSETTTDVTLQYSDLESKKKSLTIEQERIFALLEKADTLESIIALEERLSEIRYELESMESRLRLYDNQVEYSTVYIDMEEVKIYTPTAPETVGERIFNGFTRNLNDMKDFCVDFFVDLVAGSPIWVPILAVIGLIVTVIYRFKFKKRFKKMASSIPTTFVSENIESSSSNQE